jgi:SWI/SNF-related matrix-associated actin-dependent regulator 1 of chromatin subfamily A
LINLEEIGGYSSTSKLKEYNGKNPYILKMKKKLLSDGKISLTDNQIKYIRDNFDNEPVLVNKIVRVAEYLGESLEKQYELPFRPEKILIEYVLAEDDKTYHVYGKLTRKQPKSKMYFLPKNQVLDDPYFEEVNIDVDFEKYEKIDQFINTDGTIGRKVLEKQKEGIKFLLTRKGAILADQMGSGKTFQSVISAIESGAKKILIVCPTSAKINWQRELNYLQEFDVNIISGSKYKSAKFVIINYDILKNFHTLKDEEKDGIPPSRQLVNDKFDLCIIDEAHNLKNHKSIRGAIMRELCVDYNIERVWLLSGTPVANRPMDFYNLLTLIKSPIVKNWKHYVTRYCDGKQINTKTKGGKFRKIWLTDGASNLEELSIKTRNILLRRLTHEFSDMPEKTITPLYYDMDKSQEAEYNALWDEYLIERKKQKKKGKIERELVELSLLRKYIAMETIPKTIELVDDMISQGNKVVIFTCFTEELLTLSEYYGKNCVVHYGEMNNKDKQTSVDRFQKEGGPMVFIGNIISAGVAITLTRSNYMVFNSFDWVPGNIEQAEFRIYRIGQKNNVKIYYNLFNDTIITRMWATIKYKQEIINTILNDYNDNEYSLVESIIDYTLEN